MPSAAIQWIQSLFDWASANATYLWWTLAGAVAFFVITTLLVAWLIVRLPSDYFVCQRRPLSSLSTRPAIRVAALILKNVLGILLLIAGVAMWMAPGPGWLTVIAGVTLLDFPGKFRLQRWLITRPHLSRTINWLRKRAGRPPMKLAADHHSSA
jgi:hypothetical protein